MGFTHTVRMCSAIYEKPKTDRSFEQLTQLLKNNSLPLDLCKLFIEGLPNQRNQKAEKTWIPGRSPALIPSSKIVKASLST